MNGGKRSSRFRDRPVWKHSGLEAESAKANSACRRTVKYINDSPTFPSHSNRLRRSSWTFPRAAPRSQTAVFPAFLVAAVTAPQFQLPSISAIGPVHPHIASAQRTRHLAMPRITFRLFCSRWLAAEAYRPASLSLGAPPSCCPNFFLKALFRRSQSRRPAPTHTTCDLRFIPALPSFAECSEAPHRARPRAAAALNRNATPSPASTSCSWPARAPTLAAGWRQERRGRST